VTNPVNETETLAKGLQRLGYSDVGALASRLIAFGERLLWENRSTNLVGAKTLADLIAAHFLDSLAPIASEAALDNPVIDLGSGAGLPGIPIAMAYPRSMVTLMEPRAKRASFLQAAATEFGLDNVVVEKVTAETAGRSPAWRGIAGTVLIRAVAAPRVALQFGLPLLRVGGRALLYEGRRSAPDEDELAVARVVGGELEKASAVDVPYLEAVRHAWWFRKVGETPPEYPRRAPAPASKHA